MAEDTTTDAAEAASDTPADDLAGLKGALQREREERRAAQREAAEARKLRGELDKLRAASMSETERAVAEAEQRGRAQALVSAGARLARAEFRAAAAGQLSAEALDGFLEYADLGRFVGEDGEPDAKKIAAAVQRLAGPSRRTDFDGGARGNAAAPTDMNGLIRKLAGHG